MSLDRHASTTDGVPVTNLLSFLADTFACDAPLVPTSSITRDEFIGEGRTFTVYKGLWSGNEVAIKYFNFKQPLGFGEGSVEEAEEGLNERLTHASHEIRIMSHGILRRCPNLATLLGLFFEVSKPAWIRPALVLDLASLRTPTLATFLQSSLTVRRRLDFISDIFDGLYALHSVGICHGDIKPQNILLFPQSNVPERDLIAKISDFGYAFLSGKAPRGRGTSGWMAPECSEYAEDRALVSVEAYGRDVFSAALVFEYLINSTPDTEIAQDCISEQDDLENDNGKPTAQTPRAADQLTSVTRNTEKVLKRVLSELVPLMKTKEPHQRPWVENLRKLLREICSSETVTLVQWSWEARGSFRALYTIEPNDASKELRGQAATWLSASDKTKTLPPEIQRAVLNAIKLNARDSTGAEQADCLNALYTCYATGRLVDRDEDQELHYLAAAARAGSIVAQWNILRHTYWFDNNLAATIVERRDWTLALLRTKNDYGIARLSEVEASICEQGLIEEASFKLRHIARRNNEKKLIRSFDQIIGRVFSPTDIEEQGPYIRTVKQALQTGNIETLLQAVGKPASDHLYQSVIFALLCHAVENLHLWRIHLLIKTFDFAQRTLRETLMVALNRNRNDAVLALLDAGCDRTVFTDRELFADQISNTSFTEMLVFVKTCETYTKNVGPLINTAAKDHEGSNLPPPIFLAMLCQNSTAFSVLLQFKARLDIHLLGWDPLQFAVARRLPFFVAMLLDAGRSTTINASPGGRSVLHVLADPETHASTSAERFSAQDYVVPGSGLGNCRLSESQRKRYAERLILELLLRGNANIATENSDGDTPIDLAIGKGNMWLAACMKFPKWEEHSDDVRHLVSLPDFEGRTHLSYAIEDENFELANRFLEQSLDINEQDSKGTSAMYEAVESSSARRMDYCISKGATSGADVMQRGLLVPAVAGGSMEIIRTVLDLGASLTRCTVSKQNVLHILAIHNRDSLLEFFVNQIRSSASLGEKALSSLRDGQDISGRTPLHLACQPRVRPFIKGTIPLYAQLIALGSDVDAEDILKNTPLHCAAEAGDRNHGCLEAIIAARASLNVQDEFGMTAMHYACTSKSRQGLDLLKASGANESIRNSYGYAPSEWYTAVEEDPTLLAKFQQDREHGYTLRNGYHGVQQMIHQTIAAREIVATERRRQYLGR